MADWFEFAGVRSISLGVYVQDFPPVTLSEERVEFKPVLGRSGSLTLLEGKNVYEDVNLSINCFVRDLGTLDQVAAWLHGEGRLVLGNMPDRYFLARAINHVEMTKLMRGRQFRNFTVVFRCKPFRYVYPELAPATYLPITNLISNGNFVNATGWAGVGATISAAAHVLSMTGDGTQAIAIAQHGLASVIAGHKYYAFARARSRNAAAVDLVARLVFPSGTNVTVFQKTSPAQDTWYTLSGVFSQTDQSGAITFSLRATYASAAAAGGKVAEFAYAGMIDLTAAFGAGHDPSQAQMDIALAAYPYGWFDGTAAYPGVITNFGTADAEPTITVVGSGDIDLTVGERTIHIAGLASSITIDCETGQAYNGAADLTDTVMMGDFPWTIPPGISAVSWIGAVTRVTVTQPWRCV